MPVPDFSLQDIFAALNAMGLGNIILVMLVMGLGAALLRFFAGDLVESNSGVTRSDEEKSNYYPAFYSCKYCGSGIGKYEDVCSHCGAPNGDKE